MTTRFIPREKMSKKARKLLDGQKRSAWGLSPVTRRVESKKKYTRKGKSHADEMAWDFLIARTTSSVLPLRGKPPSPKGEG